MSDRQLIMEFMQSLTSPPSGLIHESTFQHYTALLYELEIHLEPQDRQALLAIIRVYQGERLSLRDRFRSDIELMRGAVFSISSIIPLSYTEDPAYVHYEANRKYTKEQQDKFREVLFGGGLDALLAATIQVVRGHNRPNNNIRNQVPMSCEDRCEDFIRLAASIGYRGERWDSLLQQARLIDCAH